jgi:hypothetical protein
VAVSYGSGYALEVMREEEGLEPVQTLVPIAANARKPKMTNAAPRIFLQEGRFAVVRCAIHQGHQCGQNCYCTKQFECPQ